MQIIQFGEHAILLLPCGPAYPSVPPLVHRSVHGVCPSRPPVGPPIRRLARASAHAPGQWSLPPTPGQQSLLGSPDQLKTLLNPCWNPTSAPWPKMSPSLALKTNKNKNRTPTLPLLTTTWSGFDSYLLCKHDRRSKDGGRVEQDGRSMAMKVMVVGLNKIGEAWQW